MKTADQQLDCGCIDEQMLDKYLTGHRMHTRRKAQVRRHLEACRPCWDRWNRVRWARAQGTRDYQELQSYLGDAFERGLDASWALADDWNCQNPAGRAAIEEFYRQTPYYLYSLLIWQASGNRPPYVARARSVLQQYRSKTICDFGCGIGNDGLILLEQGYDVIFCELNQPCTAFLKWRLKQRQLTAPVVTPDELAGLSFDTLWAMDVIEHLPAPASTLAPLLDAATVLIYTAEDTGTAGGRHPFHFQHPADTLPELFKTKGFVKDRPQWAFEVWHKSLRGAA